MGKVFNLLHSHCLCVQWSNPIKIITICGILAKLNNKDKCNLVQIVTSICKMYPTVKTVHCVMDWWLSQQMTLTIKID